MSNQKDYTISEVGEDDEISSFSSSGLPDYSSHPLVAGFNIHYNLRTLSYSGILSLHSCPRKFELSRLMVRQLSEDEDEHGHLSFGKVVGNGIQEYFVSDNRNRAMLRMFLDWNDNLDEEKGAKSAKTFWHALRALDRFITFRHEVLSEYEVAFLLGRRPLS